MRRSKRRGQAAVLIAMVLFVMLLLVAMSTNIGIVVNDRVRMQSTADLSTYAVAYSEAASLNELVELNKEIVDAVHDCRSTLNAGQGVPGTWPETTYCTCQNRSMIADTYIQRCTQPIDAAIQNFINRAHYDETVDPALDAGKATAGRNFTGVDVDFFSMLSGSPTRRGTYNLIGGRNYGVTQVIPSIADFRQVTDTKLNYVTMAYCLVGEVCVPTPMTGPTVDVNSWFYKDTRDPDVWVAGRVSGTPKKQFLDTAYGNGSDGGYFGASSTGGDDTLYAYSVAKPYDGSVGPSELNGIQQNSNMIGPMGMYLSRGTTYPKLSMYDEYRARLAGIDENLAGQTTPGELIEQDGANEGKSWNMDRFQH